VPFVEAGGRPRPPCTAAGPPAPETCTASPPPDTSAAAIAAGHDSGGLAFPGGAFPAFQGLQVPASRLSGHASHDITPAPGAHIVARTATGRPLAWRCRHGAGRVLYWNSCLLSRKPWRGLITESLAAVAPVLARARADAAVIHIDDFPAPLGLPSARAPARARPPEAAFFAYRWYPDIRRLLARHRFQATCFAVFSYTWQGTDRAPDVTRDARRDSFAAARAAGDEIGLHGLNHTPLTRAGWPGQAAMEEALRQAMAQGQAQDLGPPPTA
jgi:Predicted xylanase/chitin deacetylase